MVLSTPSTISYLSLIEGGQVGIVGIRVMGCRRRNSSLKSPTTSEITPGTDDLPVAKIEIPKISLASLPLSVKNDLDPKIQNSVDRLERFKKERAALEVCASTEQTVAFTK